MALLSTGCLRPNPGATGGATLDASAETDGATLDASAETLADASRTDARDAVELDALEETDGQLPRRDVVASLCEEFRVAPRDWRWEWEDPSANVLTLHLLTDISGPSACWEFAGFNACAWVEMTWDEGATLVRSGSIELRGCSGTCEVGDIFQTTEEWPERPPQSPTMQALVNQYGPPDDACMHMCTSDGLEFQGCWPVTGP